MADTTLFTDEDVRRFREDGFVVVEKLFNADDLRRIDAVINEVTDTALASGDYSDVLELEPADTESQPVARRIHNPFHQHQLFADMATDPRILDGVEKLFGPGIALQHSKLNMKPARVGSVVEWHQDLSYFPHTNDDLLAALVYIDDATIENGCLQVIPGQHHGYLKHENPDGTFAGMITDDLDDGRHGTPVPLPAPGGSVIFMHALTPHSSLPNRSPQPRRTLIFEYRAADAFPIEFDNQLTKTNQSSVMLRGERPRFARLGKIAPLIPVFPEAVSSLYDLQMKSRDRREKV